jgi:hypothetical protein
MEKIIDIWNLIKCTFEYWDIASSLLVLCAAVYGVWLLARGIAPVLIRLGNGLARRKIAIFAKGDAAESLKGLLQDSKLFKNSNLICVRTEGDLGKAEPASVYLVHWPDWSHNIDQILNSKNDKTALVVYAPPGNPVPIDVMARINGFRNATLVNLRGRLMNDVVLSLITTSYEKK